MIYCLKPEYVFALVMKVVKFVKKAEATKYGNFSKFCHECFFLSIIVRQLDQWSLSLQIIYTAYCLKRKVDTVGDFVFNSNLHMACNSEYSSSHRSEIHG